MAQEEIELSQKYEQLTLDFQKLQIKYLALQSDKILERFKLIMDIIIHKDAFDNEIVNMANWHIKHILEVPKQEE